MKASVGGDIELFDPRGICIELDIDAAEAYVELFREYPDDVGFREDARQLQLAIDRWYDYHGDE